MKPYRTRLLGSLATRVNLYRHYGRALALPLTDVERAALRTKLDELRAIISILAQALRDSREGTER